MSSRFRHSEDTTNFGLILNENAGLSRPQTRDLKSKMPRGTPHELSLVTVLSLHILIADDEPIARQFRRFQLEQFGDTVIAAENGRQAWELLQSHGCQLVVTDYDEHRLRLQLSERLVFFSDGLTECMNPAQELFGGSRLADVVTRTRHQPLASLVPQILDELHSWRKCEPIHDDISLVVLEHATQRRPLQHGPSIRTSRDSESVSKPAHETVSNLV